MASKFPLVTRAHHEEVVALLKTQLERTEKELHRLEDLIFQKQFGVQLHDTLPEAENTVLQAPETVDEGDAQEWEERREKARLASIARTSPSQLGPALEQQMTRRAQRMAKAAHPAHGVHPAQELFAKAKSEALN
jgi:hypothetical protein